METVIQCVHFLALSRFPPDFFSSFIYVMAWLYKQLVIHGPGHGMTTELSPPAAENHELKALEKANAYFN